MPESSFAFPLRACSLIAAALCFAAPLAAQTYPAKAVRMIVGFTADTGPDVAARVLAQSMQQTSNYNVIVDNTPGAGGLIAVQEAARIFSCRTTRCVAVRRKLLLDRARRTGRSRRNLLPLCAHV